MPLDSGGAPTGDTSDFSSFVPTGGATGATPANALDNPQVYLGRKSVSAAPGQAGAAGVDPSIYRRGYNPGTGAVSPQHVDDVKDAVTATNEFWGWSETERTKFAERLYNAGLLNDPTDMSAAASAWGEAVMNAGYVYTQSSGQQKPTPWDVINARISGRIQAGVGAGGVQVGTRTSKATNTYLPDISDAKAATTTLFQEALGRDPDDQEMQRYTSMMMAKYKAHPATTTTSVTTRKSGDTSTHTTSTGQYNPQQDLEDRVESDPEWGAYQAATTYFNALQQALAAPANLAN